MGEMAHLASSEFDDHSQNLWEFSTVKLIPDLIITVGAFCLKVVFISSVSITSLKILIDYYLKEKHNKKEDKDEDNVLK